MAVGLGNKAVVRCSVRRRAGCDDGVVVARMWGSVSWATAARWAGVRRRCRTNYSDAARKVGDGTRKKMEKMRWRKAKEER
jgi:hypothetical protein